MRAQGSGKEVVERWLAAKRLPPPPAHNLKSAPRPGACGPLPEGLAGGKTDAGCACGWVESLAPKFPCWAGWLGRRGAAMGKDGRVRSGGNAVSAFLPGLDPGMVLTTGQTFLWHLSPHTPDSVP